MAIDIASQIEGGNTLQTIRVTNVWYTEEDGYGQHEMPVLHLRGRNHDGESVYKRVVHFRPRFYITEEEFVRRRAEIESEMNKRSPQILDYEFGERLIDGEENDVVNGVKLVTELPRHVGALREDFDRTWEADVLFPDVFLKEKGITKYCTVPVHDKEIHHAEVEAVRESAVTAEIDPRYVVTDIEVSTEGGFPDFTHPDQDILVLTGYDSGDGEYWTGVLRHSSWDETDENAITAVTEDREFDTGVSYEIFFFDDVEQLVWDYLTWIRGKNPDLLTGHNSDLFDYPYLFNFAQWHNCKPPLKQLSPTGDVKWFNEGDGGGSANFKVHGIQMWDAMTAFRTMSFHDLKSYSLEYVANEVLGMGKEDVDASEIDRHWRDNPADMVSYNIRDVEAVVGYIEKSGLIDDYDAVVEVCGSQFGDAHNSSTNIDNYFLRRATHRDGSHEADSVESDDENLSRRGESA